MRQVALAVALLAYAGIGAAQSSLEAVYAIESTYAAALTLAIDYASLPRCVGTTPVGACSDPAMVERLRVLDAVATSALRGAQRIVRDGGASPQTVDGSVRVARDAVGVFDAQVRSAKP